MLGAAGDEHRPSSSLATDDVFLDWTYTPVSLGLSSSLVSREPTSGAAAAAAAAAGVDGSADELTPHAGVE